MASLLRQPDRLVARGAEGGVPAEETGAEHRAPFRWETVRESESRNQAEQKRARDVDDRRPEWEADAHPRAEHPVEHQSRDRAQAAGGGDAQYQEYGHGRPRPARRRAIPEASAIPASDASAPTTMVAEA